MFEKEAEEYIKTNNLEWELECHRTSPIGEVEQAYIKGADFGYNKANEWHFVKDGTYPTHSNRVLVFTDEGVGFGIFGLDNQKWYTYDTGFEVIAWKEIVVSELPNECHDCVKFVEMPKGSRCKTCDDGSHFQKKEAGE